MTTAELLAEIEKLPGEWRHQSSGEHGFTALLPDTIALDLHLRHIAERLAEHELQPVRSGSKFTVLSMYFCRWKAPWEDEHGDWRRFPTYAEALVAAAMEVSK